MSFPPDAKDGRSSSAPITESYPVLPLWRHVDKRFWWNEWMSKPFIDAGVCDPFFFTPTPPLTEIGQLHSFILPIMQGYFQFSQFSIPSHPTVADEDFTVEYMIISRRSRYRPGLRYQRRGIDNEAHVANFVETETITRVEVSCLNPRLCLGLFILHLARRKSECFCLYTDSRLKSGFCYEIYDFEADCSSVPLFWMQTSYGLKPPPVLSPDRTHMQNLDTLKRHFQHTIPCYGPHVRFPSLVHVYFTF